MVSTARHCLPPPAGQPKVLLQLRLPGPWRYALGSCPISKYSDWLPWKGISQDQSQGRKRQVWNILEAGEKAEILQRVPAPGEGSFGELPPNPAAWSVQVCWLPTSPAVSECGTQVVRPVSVCDGQTV